MSIKHLNIVVFFAILIIIGAINVLIPHEQIKIESENRMTKPMPEFSLGKLFSGDYFKEFDAFFADNFVKRNTYVSLSKKIKAFKGLEWGDKAELVDYAGANIDQKGNTYCMEKQRAEDKELTNKGESLEGSVENSNWGKILIYNNAAMELNTYDEKAAKNYAESINAYADRFSEINVYSLLVPTQIEFINNERYRELSVSERKTIADTQGFLNNKVIPVNVYDNLAVHSDEYIYFRTDHHWTQRGAFYGYQAFVECLGEKKPSLSDYEKTDYGEFLGSLYLVTRNEKLKENPDYIELFDPQVSHKYQSLAEKVYYNEGQVFVKKWLKTDDKYAVFLGSDQPIVKIETNQNYGRNILVLKDSYANALVPYLMGVADNIVVIDPRLFTGKVDDVIAKHDITDILFVNYALITRWDGYAQLYSNLLK